MSFTVLRRSLVAFVIGTAFVFGGAGALAAPAGPYHATGRWVTADDGRVFITNGINMVYKRAPYLPSAAGFDEDDARFLAQNGIDSVRLGLTWKAVEPRPGVYDDAYVDDLRRTAEMLAAHGITTMLDAHQDSVNERFRGEGFPDWAVLDKGMPDAPQAGFGPDYFVNLGVMASLDSFLRNERGPGGVRLQDRFAAMWGHVAKRFAGTPGLLGYDLFNEPMPGSEWAGCLIGSCGRAVGGLASANRKAGAAIRSQTAGGIVFYEAFATQNVGLPVLTGPAQVRDQGLSFHSYCLLASGSDTNDGCDFFDDAVFRQSLSYARTHASTWMLTEWGATNDSGIISAMLARADRFMVGHQYWHYCGCSDPTTANLKGQPLVYDPAKPPAGDNVNAAKLALLGRPHPRLVAGTPRRYGFDPATGAFALTYSTARADGGGGFGPGSLTTVSLPRSAYPNGYETLVSGATIVSEPDADELVLSSSSGGGEVTVSVRPRP